jgi:hypothetical protein
MSCPYRKLDSGIAVMQAVDHDRWAEAMESDECQTIRIGQLHASRCPPTQNVQLMAENEILGFEPASRLHQ